VTAEHPGPRLPPVTPEEADGETQAVFARLAPYADAHNRVFGTLMWHPQLAEAYMPFSDLLKNSGELPVRHRRLAILRTAWNCGADYQWVAHARLARGDGMTDAELARIAAGPDAAGWDDIERAVLRAADELHLDRCVSDATWAALSARYDGRRLLELVVLVGNYELIAMLTNSARIAPEEPAGALPGNRFRFPCGPLEDDGS
jgi:4-carboxymuconolactone decarboxylase